MTDNTTPGQGLAPLKSKHLWHVVDYWPAESDDPNSQRWLIKAMVDDLRALTAERASLYARIAALEADVVAYKEQAVADGWTIADLERALSKEDEDE